MKKVLKVVFPLISATIGLLAANQFNIFNLFTFIPDGYKYEVCITVYFTVADILLTELYELIMGRVVPNFYSSIEVITHSTNSDPNIKVNPTVTFNSECVAECQVTIRISGKRDHFKDSYLLISPPSFATIQSNYKRKEVKVTDNTYRISLDQLFGTNSNMATEQMFRVVFAQDPVDGESIAEITPVIKQKKSYVRYRHNTMKIKTVNRQ